MQAGSRFRPHLRDRFARQRLNLQRPALTDHIDGVASVASSPQGVVASPTVGHRFSVPP